MLECNKAETGVGPSMAEASHGCKPNWADLLAAAKIKARRRGVELFVEKTKLKSSESEDEINQKVANKKPRSPIRL